MVGLEMKDAGILGATLPEEGVEFVPTGMGVAEERPTLQGPAGTPRAAVLKVVVGRDVGDSSLFDEGADWDELYRDALRSGAGDADRDHFRRRVLSAVESVGRRSGVAEDTAVIANVLLEVTTQDSGNAQLELRGRGSTGNLLFRVRKEGGVWRVIALPRSWY